MRFAAVALDTQAIFAHRRDMGAAGDKNNLRPRLGERRAVNRADAAGANDRNAHEIPRIRSAQMIPIAMRPNLAANLADARERLLSRKKELYRCP